MEKILSSVDNNGQHHGREFARKDYKLALETSGLEILVRLKYYAEQDFYRLFTEQILV